MTRRAWSRSRTTSWFFAERIETPIDKAIDIAANMPAIESETTGFRRVSLERRSRTVGLRARIVLCSRNLRKSSAISLADWYLESVSLAIALKTIVSRSSGIERSKERNGLGSRYSIA